MHFDRQQWYIMEITALIALLSIGLAVARDFAIPMDEPNMHQLAIDTWEYLKGNASWPDSVEHRFHGPLVESGIFAGQHLIGASTTRMMITMRHAFTFLWFTAGVIAFFFLAKRLFHSHALGFLGATMLILTPRIFGQAFINSRDIPFLSLFTIAMLLLMILVERRTLPFALLFGLGAAAAFSVRTMGVFLPVIGLLMLIVTKGSEPRRKTLLMGTLSLFATGMGTVFLWPLLWEHPLRHFLDALAFSGSFTGGGYFLGKDFTATPWYYVPIWMIMTIPLPYTLCTGIGIPVAIARIRTRNAALLLPLLWLAVPLVTLIVSRAGIYNDWRHVYFVYPGFLLLTLAGLHWLKNRSVQMAWIIACIFGISFLHTTYAIARDHPLQMLSFEIPASWVQNNFELDYWALSSRKALETIASRDDNPLIGLTATNAITFYNAYAFFPDRMFYKATSDAASDYIIDTSREQKYAAVLPAELLLEEIRVGNVTVARVYKGPYFVASDPKRWPEQRAEIAKRPRPAWTYGTWVR